MRTKNLKATFASIGLASVLGGLTPSHAAERAIYLAPAALSPGNGATVGSPINLPDTANPGFFMSFALPPDYALNTTAKVRIYLSTPTPPSDCNVILRVFQAVRRRAGEPAYSSVHPNIDRVTLVGGEATTMPSTGAIVVKTVTVRPPLSAPFTGLRVGDLVTLRIDRMGTDGGDTCTGFLFVQGVEIRYAVTP